MCLLAMDIDCGFDLEGAIERARKTAGLKHEALAALMGLPSQRLSHQLARREHLSFHRVLLCAKDEDGRRFLQHLWIEIADWLQIADKDAVACQLAHLAESFHALVAPVRRRMLKADLEPIDERKRA